MKFFIVDAFTAELFGGNPAGVVLIPGGADFPDDETMRRAAAELRYSETAFVKRLGATKFRTRYFTPAAEVDLCGHATIAAFHALRESGRIGAGKYTNSTRAGDLTIEFKDGAIWMDMAAPAYLRRIDTADGLGELYAVMGLDAETDRPGPDTLSAPTPSSPPDPDTLLLKDPPGGAGQGGDAVYPEIISTGLPDIILPVVSMERLNAINPDYPALAGLSKRYGVAGVHAFCPPDGDAAPAPAYHCRNFAPLYGIDEEAATGTANGALTYYLYRRSVLRPDALNVFIQGEAMGRPSRVLTRLAAGADEARGVTIKVGGAAITLAAGDIRL
jgi:predicted PhzF superfamily epimerase YddE/YHI9